MPTITKRKEALPSVLCVWSRNTQSNDGQCLLTQTMNSSSLFTSTNIPQIDTNRPEALHFVSTTTPSFPLKH